MTDFPIEHKQTGGWAGGGESCGVECACGETFDGFATLAEAREQLDAHIEDERVKADVPTEAPSETSQVKAVTTSAQRRLAEAVKRARREARLTQRDVYLLRGPSVGTLRTIENGRAELLRPSTARRLDDALGWPAGTSLEIQRGQVDEAPARDRSDGPSVLHQLIAASVAATKMRVLSGGGS